MNYSSEKMNQSELSLNSTEYLQIDSFHVYLNQHLAAKISYYFLLLVIHILGPILILGIISFERKEGDPQKRNVINRLFSMALINAILLCILIGGCRTWGIMIGLISSNTMFWIEFFGYILCNNVMLFMNEMTILRYLHIIVWKRVKDLDDEFWAFVLSITTFGVSLWQCIYEHTPAEVRMLVFKVNMEYLPETVDEKR